MKIKMMTLCLALVAGGAYAQHDHAGHHDQKKGDQNMVMFKDTKLGVAYEHYIHVKDALVASNANDAKTAAGQLQKALKDVKGSAKAIEAAENFVKASDLTEQREVFSSLSNEMAILVKGGKLSMGSLYLEYCPMANNNEGAILVERIDDVR